ncbi:MAG: cation diffusion facilitator family transporter [Candidatus Levyibacteriota bacterium]
MTQQKRLGLILGLNLVMISGLIIVGLTSHSLGVLAAGGDYASDSLAILLGIIAIQIRNHQKHSNATTYVALINALALLIVTLIVIVEGVHRLTSHTIQIEGLSTAVVSAIATIFMGIGAFILGRDSAKEDLHMRSVLLDTISDGATSAAVAISGLIIFLTGKYYWLDSIIAIVIGIIIGFGALRLLRDTINALRSQNMRPGSISNRVGED